jgi:hypothetical protein
MTMAHISEDDLILYFYGERGRAGGPGKIDRHLEECPECSALYRDIAGTLALIDAPDTPARDERYAADVWQRIRYELPDQEHVGWLAWLRWNRVALAGAAAALLVAAFGAGRAWPRPDGARPAASDAAATGVGVTGLDPSGRVRLAAIGDHLEQSERVLLDVVNAQGSPVDVSAQQIWAAALVDSNRFYRDAAASAGDADVANLLDDLERSLLDIVHGPSKLTPAQLDETLVRLDAATLLFKVRVLSDELHERELAPVKPPKTI